MPCLTPETSSERVWEWRRGAHTPSPPPPRVIPVAQPWQQAANGNVWPYLPPSRTHALLLLGCSRTLGCWHCFFFPFFFPCEKKSIEESFLGKIWTTIKKYTGLCKQVRGCSEVRTEVWVSRWEEGKLRRNPAAEEDGDMHVSGARDQPDWVSGMEP